MDGGLSRALRRLGAIMAAIPTPLLVGEAVVLLLLASAHFSATFLRPVLFLRTALPLVVPEDDVLFAMQFSAAVLLAVLLLVLMPFLASTRPPLPLVLGLLAALVGVNVSVVMTALAGLQDPADMKDDGSRAARRVFQHGAWGIGLALVATL